MREIKICSECGSIMEAEYFNYEYGSIKSWHYMYYCPECD